MNDFLWGRWWLRHLPLLLYRRLRYCAFGHSYTFDGLFCANCAHPWTSCQGELRE